MPLAHLCFVVLLYANTHFDTKPGLAPWEHSLDALQILARDEWKTPVQRTQNLSADEFLRWLAGTPGTDPVILYFATHQLRDGSLLFAHGPRLPAKDFIVAVNRLAESRRVTLINDSCYAEKLESCGQFVPNVVRLYACRSREISDETKLRDSSPAAMNFFRPERDWLESRTGQRVPSASFLALLLCKASREGKPIRSLRDEFDRQVMQAHVQTPVIYPADAEFELPR